VVRRNAGRTQRAGAEVLRVIEVHQRAKLFLLNGDERAGNAFEEKMDGFQGLSEE
jgi:hypothetical protein